jgi:hypothetical protein
VKLHKFSKSIFKIDETIGVSKFRISMMRFMYVVTIIWVGGASWFEILTHQGTWDPLYGMAYSLYAALSALMILGVRFPLRMLPLMLLQFLYKLIC